MPLLALLPYALSLVPELLTVFAGDRTGKLAEQAADMVRTATGTTDPREAQNKLAGDKDAMTALRIQLAGIIAQQEAARDAARNDALRIAVQSEVARLADVQNARARDTALREKGVRNVRADVMVALTIFGIIACLWFLRSGAFPAGSDVSGCVLGLVGLLSKCFADAFSFEFGSSRGSADKAAAMERLATSAQQPAGAAVATTGDVTIGSGAAGVSVSPAAVPRPDMTADEAADLWNPTVPRGRTP